MTTQARAKNGDTVKIHFIGKTVTGDVFASSHEEGPIEFKIGEGDLLPGIEKAVEGMVKGEHKTITLNPEEGFGDHHEELILQVERNQFPHDFEPEVGMQLQVPQPDGTFALFKVLEVGNENVKLDANHPLAGETITFDLELLEIE